MPSGMVFDGNDVTSKRMRTAFKRVSKREIFCTIRAYRGGDLETGKEIFFLNNGRYFVN